MHIPTVILGNLTACNIKDNMEIFGNFRDERRRNIFKYLKKNEPPLQMLIFFVYINTTNWHPVTHAL